jgi:tape measure domain-containing protein
VAGSNDLTAKIKIDGDAAGAVKATEAVESSLNGLNAAAKKVDLSNVGEKASASLNKTASSASAVNAAFATLNIRSADQIQAEINSINKALVTLASNAKVSGGDFDRAYAGAQTRLTALRGELNAAEGASTKTGSAVAGMGSQLLALAGPLAGIAIGKAFVDANVSAESLERTLTQLTGSGEAAATEIDYLRAASERMGLNVQDASRAYVSLTASAKGTALEGQATRDIFEAVAGAMSKLGKSSADTEGALQAVSQMMSKGTVSMEEMRQQLGERLPGAMQATATELGVTVGELGTMIESGQVLAADVLPAMAQGLEKMYGTAGQAEGSVAAWNRLKNAINDTFLFVGDSGVWSGLVSVLSGAATAVSGLTGAFELLGKTIGITFGAIATFDWKHPIDSFNNWKKAVSEAGADIQSKLDKVKKSAEEAGPAQVKLAEQGKQAADAAKEQGVSWLGVVNAYAKVGKASEEAAGQAVKSAAARTEENKAAVALAAAFGTEAEQRAAASQAAESNAAALAAVAEARRIEAAVAESNVIALQKAAEAEGKLSDEKAKAIQKAQDSAAAKQAEAEKTAAAALAAGQHAAALAVEGQALADNSARVGELKAAHEAAAAALDKTRLAHEQGAATLAQVQQAEIAAGQAATLYRDALEDLSTGIAAKSRVEQASMDVTAAGLKLQIAQVESQYQVAKAYGDEAAAAQYLMQKKQLEIELAALTAQAKRAEADAALLSTKARWAEAEASGQLTVAKIAELKAQEAAAQVKQIEAQIAEETASRMRDLALATDESGSAARNASGDFDSMASSLDGVKRAADGAAASVEGVRGPGERVAGVDVKSVLYKNGATVEEAKAAEKYYGELYQREAATRLTGNLGTDANAAYQTNLAQKFAAEEALRLARQELSTGKAVDLGTPVNELIAKNRATGNIGLTSLGGENNLIKDIEYAGLEAKASAAAVAAAKATNPYAPAPSVSYTVDLRTDNGTSSVGVNTEKDAQDLFDALKSYAARAA